MQLQVRKKELETAVQQIGLVVESKTTIPIIAGVRIGTDGERTTLQGTDLDRFLTVELDSEQVTVKGTGQAVISHKHLSKTLANVRVLDADTVTISSGKDNWVELVCGDLKVKLPGFDPKGFPVPQTLTPQQWIESHYLDTATLRGLIARSKHAISDSESRYTLNGALLRLEPERLRMVTTDGHRLANVSRNGYTYRVSSPAGIQTLIARDTVEVLAKLLDKRRGDVQFNLSVEGDRQFFKLDNWELSSRTLTGQFPNYTEVIPKTEHTRSTVTVDAQTLAQVVKRVGMYADERSGCMRFELVMGQGLVLSAKNSETGEAQETVRSAQVETPAAKVEHIAFDHRYVLDVLGTFDKAQSIQLHVLDERSPAVWKPVRGSSEYECDYVLMPMRD